MAFGPYRLYRSQKKVLFESDQQVRLGSRAFDILVALVERAGELVTKRELMAYAWPNAFVEESNLRVHVAALRRILGDGQGGVRYIVNVSGRGYCFLAPVRRLSEQTSALPTEGLGRPALPAPLARAVGRREAVEAISTQFPKRRLLTIVGPAGVGKSTVALAVAEALLESYSRRATFVDLSAIEDPSFVPAAVATAMGISVLANDPIASLIAFLRNRRVLLVLDNCEHVINYVAKLAEQVLRASPGLNILATSREPLLAASESVYRLPALRTPPPSATLTADEAQLYPAVALFVERAMSGADTFELSDRNAPQVARICHHLDGMPLAIELAAARIDMFGIDGLASRLVDQLLVVTKGRRTAHPHHGSLRSTLDWSFELLPSQEQCVLRRLAVFRGPFTVESAVAVVSDASIPTADVVDGIISLVAKSLITADVTGHVATYRLLHVTRIYALEKLTEIETGAAVVRRHAEHYRTLLEAAQAEWEVISREQWLSRYGDTIDDVRCALDWAFSENGDLTVAASLTAASLPFGLQLSLLDEFQRRAQLALDALTKVSPPQDLIELRLTSALVSFHANLGSIADNTGILLDRAKTLANRIGIPRYKIAPLIDRAIYHIELGDYSGALDAADDLAQEARLSEDPLAILISDRVGAQTSHWAGHHQKARMLLERVLRHPARAIPFVYSPASIDRRVSMNIVLARILWIQGFPDEANKVAQECLQIASTAGAFARSQALALAACPIACWRGDYVAAQRWAQELVDLTYRHTMPGWHKLACCFHIVVADLLDGEPETGPESPLVLARPAGPLHRDELATISDYWLDTETIERAEGNNHSWCAAEVLRISGERALKDGGPEGQRHAEFRFRQAIEIASSQGAVGWELRSATSLAHLLKYQGRGPQAMKILKPVYERFTEGHNTADLRDAHALLEVLSSNSEAKKVEHSNA